VLGDQLDAESAVFDGFDPSQDLVLMVEAAQEATHVWSHKARIALFLSAMRHFAQELELRGFRVDYRRDQPSLPEALSAALREHQPDHVVMVQPGDHRVLEQLRSLARIEILEDRHFYCSLAEFERHARGRKRLMLEFFYRELRQRHGVLIENGGPVGGAWNFDHDNRGSFPKSGPPPIPAPRTFPPDAITREVLTFVERRYATHPGSLNHFDFPVTAADARLALEDFIDQRLPSFGTYQDAMWTGEPYLYHSRLSAAMNLKLLNPRLAVAAAEQAAQSGHAPLPAVEGFIRQILGWREYVRGIYWTFMPGYADRNALAAHQPLPDFYWTGETDMQCLRHSIRQTLDYGYAHHIQRLMVTGLYALLLGVDPRQIHEWYLAVYVDAVEWVELPNVIGMSQFADGGIMATKPYAATGKYIQRMSNYCSRCRYDPAEAVGDRACPFTTLYWDFLMRHEQQLKQIPRMDLQLRNLIRLTPERRAAITEQAGRLRSHQGATHECKV
jgi:deoxyribodipyrimidine photolyase-related protein